MSKTAIFIHGFNVWDGGRATIGKFIPFWENVPFKCHELQYGWRGLIGVRIWNRRTARRLAELSKVIEGEVVAVGHSNGCAIIHRATRIPGNRISGVVYINPALDRDMIPGPKVKFCHVWHNEDDKAVRWARILMKHPWGPMGAYGYMNPENIPPDARVKNYDTGRGFEVARAKGHSGIFRRPEALAFFGPKTADEAAKEIA